MLPCRNFVTKHRLSIQIGAINVQKRLCNVYTFQLSFHFAYHRCWLGSPLCMCLVQLGWKILLLLVVAREAREEGEEGGGDRYWVVSAHTQYEEKGEEEEDPTGHQLQLERPPGDSLT